MRSSDGPSAPSQCDPLKRGPSGRSMNLFIHAVKPQLRGLADIGKRFLVRIAARVASGECRNLGAIRSAFILIYDCLKTHLFFILCCTILSHISVLLSTSYFVCPNLKAREVGCDPAGFFVHQRFGIQGFVCSDVQTLKHPNPLRRASCGAQGPPRRRA